MRLNTVEDVGLIRTLVMLLRPRASNKELI